LHSAAADSRCSEAGSANGFAAGEYRCASAYPSPGRSIKLGRQNLHLFRLKNTRFDVIGGLVYFFLVVRFSCPLQPADQLQAADIWQARRHGVLWQMLQ
jgi:hypothetical protein